MTAPHASGPHAPGPADLVAVVSFDGEEYPNQAVTRDRLGEPAAAPHALAATMQSWLGRGRRLWVDVRGRQIVGIASARDLATGEAWEIDTLVDASGPGERDVETALLRQVADAASEAGVGRVQLRVATDSRAAEAAVEAGFAPALEERLWRGPAYALRGAPSDGEYLVREATDAEAFLEFQLYGRTLPFEARRGLGMTFDEWAAAQERRWAGRGRQYVAMQQGAVRASLRTGGGQFALLAEPGAEAAATTLLHAAAADFDGHDEVLALLPECAGTPASALRDLGFEASTTYMLLVLRTQQTVREAAGEPLLEPLRRMQRGTVVSTRG